MQKFKRVGLELLVLNSHDERVRRRSVLEKDEAGLGAWWWL
jgi:hypothetical protein